LEPAEPIGAQRLLATSDERCIGILDAATIAAGIF
jgi:hypothetical protein